MLVFNPDNRISAEEAYLHPFSGGNAIELEPIRNLPLSNNVPVQIKIPAQ